MSSRAWERVVPLLPAQYTSFAYDLRGFGGSEHCGNYSFASHLEDLAAFLDVMEARQAILVGHSMGANLLQDFAIANGGRCLAVVLSNASARVLPPPDPVANRVAERLALFDTADTTRKALELGVPRYFDAGNLRPGEISEWIDIGLQADREALRAMLKANYSLTPIPRKAYDAITAPTLIVASSHDSFSPPSHIRALSDAMPNSAISTIEDCGHTPMWEKPRAWGDAVSTFLNSQFGDKR